MNANAQSSAHFEAYSDAKEITLNGIFEVTFSLRNGNGTDFSPPDFRNFTVLSGPNSSTSIQIVNGKVSREQGFSYQLQPKKLGKFVIEGATIKVSGKKLRADPITVYVVKGNARPGQGNAKGEVYIQMEPSKTTAYPGEQILLDFKLYTTVSIDGYDFVEEPEYRGFYAQELRRFNSRKQGEVINGKQVTTKVLRRLSLFPQQSGRLTIPPARIQLAVVEENEQTGFFFNRKIRPVAVTTEPVEIEIKALPEPAPESFTGSVGEFTFTSSVNRNRATTDDAVSVMMLINGNGDIKRVQPPQLMLSDSFEIYPPKVIEESNSEIGGELTGKKIIEYLILPKYPGEYSIQPVFSYFDPVMEDYETIRTGPYFLNVKQGTDRHGMARNEMENRPEREDIKFIKLRTRLTKDSGKFVGSPVFWVLTTLPVLAFAGLFFRQKLEDKAAAVDDRSLKRVRASEVAQKRLLQARAHMESGASRVFYDEVSKASLGYVCDKLNIPLSELSKDNVRGQLALLDISPDLVEGFMHLMQTCEMALYAGRDNSADMKRVYDEAVTVISGIEEELGN